MNSQSADFVIVGAGVVGLTLARELVKRKLGRVLIIEKEDHVGAHASGRNSGVVHAGIYYPAGSMKAKFCVDGARRLLEYVDEHSLPILKCGKVIVATRPENVTTLGTLLERAKANGVEAEKISVDQLREYEPQAKTHEWAIWSPKTAVIDSKAVLRKLSDEVKSLGAEIVFTNEIKKIDPAARVIESPKQKWSYGFLFNTAGVYADRIAHPFGVGLNYRIMPFKGLYWKSSEEFSGKIRRLIYPAPDIGMPFLGVHITRTVDGKVLFGPTAIPAFGRENYSLLGGLDLLESPSISWHLLKMLIRNPGNFRAYVREEMARYNPTNFYKEAKNLVQELKRSDIGDFYKVGIRAQLMDLTKGQLEMDFVIKRGEKSLHVLNAISPAFTSSFAFAPYLVEQALESPTALIENKTKELEHV
ncbi:MAG: L-2-hydroxyglutarate oxidase [Bdellovibrionales bacterium]